MWRSDIQHSVPLRKSFAPQIFPDPEHSLQPRQSGERLIPGAQPGSETIEDVDDELLVVPADDGHLSGRKSVVEVSSPNL